MKRDKKPLYRKVNTRTRNHFHPTGPDARHSRNTKAGISRKMVRGEQRGLDYTPLYKFLLSAVGRNWDEVYSEAKNRLDKEDPIWHLVAKPGETEVFSYVRIGESAYFSSLFVNPEGVLCLVDPELSNEDLFPTCHCCTHTFNGKVLSRKYDPEKLGHSKGKLVPIENGLNR